MGHNYNKNVTTKNICIKGINIKNVKGMQREKIVKYDQNKNENFYTRKPTHICYVLLLVNIIDCTYTFVYKVNGKHGIKIQFLVHCYTILYYIHEYTYYNIQV